MTINLNYNDFLNLLNNKSYLSPQCVTQARGYLLVVIDGGIIYKCEIDDAENIIDFETKYKNNWNQSITNRNNYISQTIEITNYDNFLELNLGKLYKAFTLIVQGDNDIIIKLNDINNNEIPLQGTKSGKDVIDADPFDLSKIYYKLKESGKNSKMTIWAIG